MRVDYEICESPYAAMKFLQELSDGGNNIKMNVIGMTQNGDSITIFYFKIKD